MVLTSHDELGDTGRKTGFWLEEFAPPYYVFLDAGADVTLVSPKGGQPPLDPKSDEPYAQTAATERLKQDIDAQAKLASTTLLSDIAASSFDGVFCPAGHGPLWDLAEDANSIKFIETVIASGNPVAAVCHAPGVLKNVNREDGQPVVSGKKVTGFANSEENVVQLFDIVPFLVEDMLKEKEGIYAKGADWSEFVLEDGLFDYRAEPGIVRKDGGIITGEIGGLTSLVRSIIDPVCRRHRFGRPQSRDNPHQMR